MDQRATLPRLPSAPTESSEERLRELRDFHFGHAAPSGRSSLTHHQLRPAVFALLDSDSAGAAGEAEDLRAPLHALLEVARELLPPRRAALAEEISRLRDGLQGLLKVEDGKDPRPDALRSAVGSIGSSLVDPDALADLMGEQRGSVRVDARRRERIELALEVFERMARAEEPPLLTVVHEAADREAIPEDPQIRAIAASDPCRAGATQFDREAERWTELFRAMRTARLEIAVAYDAERHDPWLEALDWEGFTRDELLAIPPVVALESAPRLSDARMSSLSRLLRSGRPVHTLAIAAPCYQPPAEGAELFSSYRLELGFLGIGHREAFVQQSSTSQSDYLSAGFTRSLCRTRSALHVVQLDHLGAATRSRAHPVFRYDPEAGRTWARRLEFAGNPDPEADWAEAALACSTANGGELQLALRFTYADYAFIDPAFASEFRVVSDTFQSEDLVPLSDYLELDADYASRRIPFVWAVDRDRDMHRIAVTRRLIQGCRDRLDFWRTLQELAGVRNEHVERALEQVREEARRDREEHVAAQATELELAQSEAVNQAMQRLAVSLVELGPDGFAETVLADGQAMPETAERATAIDGVDPAKGETPPDDAETAVSPEPWIQTALCTSCNDCRDINPQVFVYDKNKQAVIGDARAGTYAQLVKAAEKCPAHCIHPGLPLNPDEPNVSALIARAEPFN